tara:strand:+ start:608 stop:841 length:234 start_codon:yes stop_codon:yes gene_type:complete
VRTQKQIKNYSQIVHLYYSEGILSLDEAEEWMGEMNCTLNEIRDNKIVFTYMDEWYPTRMTVFKSGNVTVETDLEDL